MYDIWNFQERVKMGTELLDRKEPGWRDRIAPGDLEMASCERCVMGQAFGTFMTGTDLLGIYGRGSEYGFDFSQGVALKIVLNGMSSWGTVTDFKEQEYAILEELWVDVIKNV